jgi:hypothetical protein
MNLITKLAKLPGDRVAMSPGLEDGKYGVAVMFADQGKSVTAFVTEQEVLTFIEEMLPKNAVIAEMARMTAARIPEFRAQPVQKTTAYWTDEQQQTIERIIQEMWEENLTVTRPDDSAPGFSRLNLNEALLRARLQAALPGVHLQREGDSLVISQSEDDSTESEGGFK